MNSNYEVSSKVVDGYTYRFYGDLPYENEMIKYAQMSKRFMNRPFNSPLDIVGNYDWHQEFPYEEHLRMNEFVKDAKVIDWGCGPGRMVERARKLFDHVDGIDISEYAIDYARQTFPGSTFFVSSGVDVGDAPENFYDLAYSTIALQHVPCRTIRKNILRGLYNILAPGGMISLQVAYNPDMQAGVWSSDTEHASYESDFFNAKATNGHADMVINKESIGLLKTDFEIMFNDVQISLVNVSNIYSNLNGRYHAPYWATDWLFVSGTKE